MSLKPFKFEFPCMVCGERITHYEELKTAIVLRCECGWEYTETKADFIKRLEIASERLKAQCENQVKEIEILIAELKKTDKS